MIKFKTAQKSLAIVLIGIVVCLFFSIVGVYAEDVKDTPLPVTEQITGQDGDLTLLAGDVGVTMDYTEVNVAKGDHYGLNVTTNPVNASITWSIGNALVANVSSDGIITGLKEGTTTIIASFEYNGELYAASCVVRVGPATGLYKIKNKNSSKYLHVNSGSIANLTTVQQYSSYSASSPQYMIRQLWRVAYVSTNGGFYTIRPYYKMDMLLCGYNGSACITSASYTDSYQDCASGMWEIYTIGNAYIFNYNGLTSFTMQVYNASKDNGAAVKAASDTGTNSSRWTLEAVSSAPAGIKMYNSSGTPITSAPTHYIGVGETKTIVGRGLKIQFYANTTPLVVRAYNNNINHTSSNTSVVTITTKGKAKGIAEGNAVITAKVTYSSQSLTTTYNIGVIAVPSGKYFFENRTTEKYLQIDDGETNTVGAVMEQWAFDGGDDQKWVVTSLNNGYYKIVSSETGYALSVPSGSETAENVSLVQQAYTGATRQQWKITETANGSYKIKARSSESYTEKDLVMDVQYSLLYQHDNGIDVQQRAYLDNNSYMDEWYFVEANHIYGYQEHRVLTAAQREVINCHGYAMMRNDWPDKYDYADGQSWNYRAQNYFQGVTSITNAVKRNLATYTKADFEEWLTEMGYTWEYESDFDENGSFDPIRANQYRVVLRTGVQHIGYQIVFDYHFWYQTYDGTWSNKHGDTIEEHLPEGVTPFTTGTSGWDCAFLGVPIVGFYDSEIYSYIITIN